MLDLAVGAVALIAGALGWVAVRGSPELVLHRRVQPARLHVGSDGRIDLLVENRGRRTTPVLAATDSFDEGRRAARFLVPPLAPGTTGRAAYRIPTRRRGRYQVGPLWLAATDPFGLARRAWAGLGVSELVVRPRVHDIAAPVGVGSRMAAAQADEPTARALMSDLGDDFLNLREYTVGDDLRRVHWRSTARTGELMIRQDEARWRSRAAVVLDGRPQAYDRASFEVAVEAVASVVARLVRLRRRVEVVTSAGEVLGTGGDPRHDVIDRLATVGPDPVDRLATVLAGIRAHHRADLVVAVLRAVDDTSRGPVTTLVGLVVYVALAREWSTTWYGIPRGATWHAVVHQLDTGWSLLRTAPAPAAVTNGALLLAVIATWVMATIADTLAFRRHATLASVAPALVLFVWSATLGTTHYRVETTAGFAAAAAAFLLVQNLAVMDRRRSWLVSRRPGRPHTLAPAALLGVGAIVVGLVVAPLLPGANSEPLVDFRNAGRDRAGGHTYRTAVAPLVDVGAKLQQRAERQVFTVQSGGVPDYWRIAALDQYTGPGGGQWTLSAQGN